MDDLRVHVRHCLLYEFQQGHTAADATRNICTFVAPDALSHSMAKYWFHRFRQGNLTLEDRPRSGRPSTIDINRLQALIRADPTRTTRNLATELQTSHSTIERHLHSLEMRFHADRWVYFGNADQPSTSSSRLNVSTSYDTQLMSTGSVSAATSTSSSSSAWPESFITTTNTTPHQSNYNWRG